MKISIKNFHLAIILIFCLGIFLRLKTYLYNISFWYDEAALALNIMDRGFSGFFRYLDYIQCAPPLFMIFSKIATNIFGTKEWVFRLLPLIFGIASMFAFYYLSKDILNKKWSILIANFLFAVNFQLIYYCQEFKQYSLEVLVTILAIYFVKKINLKTLNSIKCLCLGIIFFVLFLLSMTAPFILAAYMLYIAYKNKKTVIKQWFCIVIPFIFLLTPYYLFYLWPSKALMVREFSNMWSSGYLNLNFESIRTLAAEFFQFTFQPNSTALLSLILCAAGSILVFKDKRPTGAIILLILIIAITASFLHIYPIYIRLGLYLIPLLILLCVKPLDICNINIYSARIRIYSFVVIFMFLFCFRNYNFNYFINFFNPMIFHQSLSRQMMEIIKDNLDENDIVVYDGESLPAYFYYLRYFNINHKNSIDISSKAFSEFKSLYGSYVWFYCTHKVDIKGHVALIKKLVHEGENVKILYEKEESGSYIVKVKL